jgi:hypothetical protein
MNVTITIEREKVLQIVEGLSATIAQHNAGVPTFEQLWASESERRKLDIWWRDAANDLEDNLKKWLTDTTPGYDLSTAATDYSLTLNPGDYWSTKLTGLLKNRLQYYFVHSVMAGWLGDFTEVNAPNYGDLAMSDLKGILNVMNFRELAFEGEVHREDTEEKAATESLHTGESRREDTDGKDGDGHGGSGESRREDEDEKDDGEHGGSGESKREDTEEKAATESLPTGESRRGDTEEKAATESLPTGESRRGDTEGKDGGGHGGSGESRRGDTEWKDSGEHGGSGESRREDDEDKAATQSQQTLLGERERDDLKPYRVGRDLMRETRRFDGLYFDN